MFNMYPQLIHHFLLPVYTPYLHQHSPCDPRQNPRSYPHISQCFLLHPVDLQVLLKITLASIKTSIIPLPKSPSLSLHILGPGLTASGSSIASHPPWSWASAPAAGSLQNALQDPFTQLPPACPSGPSSGITSVKKTSLNQEAGLRVFLFPCDDSIIPLIQFIFSQFTLSVLPRDCKCRHYRIFHIHDYISKTSHNVKHKEVVQKCSLERMKLSLLHWFVILP